DGVVDGGAVDLQDGRGGEELAGVGDGPGPPAEGAGQEEAGAVGRVAVGIGGDELEVLGQDVGQPGADLGPALGGVVVAEHAAEPADQDDRVAGGAGSGVEEGDGADLRGRGAGAADQVGGDVGERVGGQRGDVVGHPHLVAADDVDAPPVLG